MRDKEEDSIEGTNWLIGNRRCHVINRIAAPITGIFTAKGDLGKGNGKVGMGIDRTLKTCPSIVIHLHPKIRRVSTKLIFRSIEADGLTEILRREETNRRTRDVMTRY